MKKVLVLGGTKYVGKALISELTRISEIHVTVFSRHPYPEVSFMVGERKNQNDLDLILQKQFDIIIDFIGYCLPDMEKLTNAIKQNTPNSKLIFISTTYVYDLTLKHQLYNEEHFNPLKYTPLNNERSEISYEDGKRSSENYLERQYKKKQLCILRFPIILGSEDYTGRTNYFKDFIKTKNPNINFEKGGKSNFIFKDDIVLIILELINCFKSGTFNVARPDFLSQEDLYQLTLKILGNTNSNKTLKNELIKSPFYYSDDFMICTDKLKKHFILKNTFEEMLTKALF